MEDAHGPTLKSILPEHSKNWIPNDILSISCKVPSAARKLFLLHKYGITELHWASLTGCIEDAEALLKKDAEVHKTTRPDASRQYKEIQGVTPLFLAARSGHAALVKVLLKHGSVDDILKAGKRGDTALHAAALSGNEDVMKLLLGKTPHDRRAVDARKYNYRTPLHYAACGGQPAIVSALLRADADVSAKDCERFKFICCCSLHRD